MNRISLQEWATSRSTSRSTPTPIARGQGIGRRLWQHALKNLSSVECIGLEAAVQMVGFYEKAGSLRRQISDQSQHPNTTLLQRSDISVIGDLSRG